MQVLLDTKSQSNILIKVNGYQFSKEDFVSRVRVVFFIDPKQIDFNIDA